MKGAVASSEKIRRARKDIARLLDRYRLTLPEVIGISGLSRDDEAVWNSFREDYERIQRTAFRETYPRLWTKLRKR